MFSPKVISVVIPAIVWLAGMCHVTRAADCIVNDFAVQQNFSITAFAGRWYELNFLPPYFEAMYAPWMDFYEQYTLDNSTGTPVLNISYAGRDAGKNFTCVVGTNNPLQAWNQNNPAKMYYVKPFNSSNTINLDHWVIGTDYVTYAVVYGCPMLNSSGTCQEPAAWVYSRTRAITNTTVLDTINNLLASVCLDINSMITTWQNDTLCPEDTVTSTTSAQPAVTSSAALPANTTATVANTTKGAGSQLMTSPELLYTLLLLLLAFTRRQFNLAL